MITQAICFLNLTYKIMCSETFPFCSNLFEGVKVDQCQPSNTASGTGPAGPRVLQASLQLRFPWHQSLLSIPRTAGWPIGCDQSVRQFLSNARCNVSCRRPSVSVAIRWRCWERRKRNQVSREAGLGRGKKQPGLIQRRCLWERRKGVSGKVQTRWQWGWTDRAYPPVYQLSGSGPADLYLHSKNLGICLLV